LVASDVLQQLDVKVTPVLASLGVLWLAVALALQDTLSNMFAGLYVIADQPVRVGDYVRLENGDRGRVDSIGWRTTRIRTLANITITVPNSKLAQSIITNFSQPEPEQSIVVPLAVAYGADLEEVERLTCDVARDVLTAVQGEIELISPFVRYSGFGEKGIELSVTLKVKPSIDRFLVTHELVKHLQKRFLAEGIQISSPAGRATPRVGDSVAEP
jgi:small-conductance mechanosensitive channel